MKYIKESDYMEMTFPECTCAYLHVGEFFLVELNSGLFRGSMTTKAGPFKSYGDVVSEASKHSPRFLRNYIICSDATILIEDL